MAAGEMEHGVELRGFAGEAPSVPEHLLPGHVSPSALNIDYQDGTLRKRAGVSRISRNGMLSGGVWVRARVGGVTSGILETISGVTLAGTVHTYECVVATIRGGSGSDMQVWRHVTSSTDGTALFLVYDSGTYKWEARVQHSGGTLAVTQSAGTFPSARVPQVVTVSFDEGTGTLTLTVDGDDSSDTIGGNTYTEPAGKMVVGGESGTYYGHGAIVSDFRVWGGTVASSLQTDFRALTAAEQTSALLAWWRFLGSNVTADSSGNGNIWGPAATANPGYWGREFCHGYVPSADTFAEAECLVYANFSGFWYRLLIGTRNAIYPRQSSGNSHLGTPIPVGQVGAINNRGPFRMQGLRYRDYVVFMNGKGQNTLVVFGSSSIVQLSYAAPVSTTAPTATAAGSGGSLSAGVYQYLYAIYNSTTGVESAVGTFISSATAVSNDEITLDLTSNGFMPDRYASGADTIRIYRTTAGGSVYYHLVDKAIDATSHADGESDATLQADSVLPTFVGYAAPSRFGFEMDDRLWLGNQAGNESRLVYTERFTLAAFYAENYVDVGYGDGDVLTGGYGVADRAVVFKRRSTWIVASSGGTPTVYKLAAGVGCVQHATIAAAHNALFWMGEGGVYTMPLPLGAGPPVSLTGNQWRHFFEGFTDADYERCSGCWDPIKERYLLTIVQAGERQVLVYTAANQAWALWDVAVSTLVVLAGGGDNRVFCGWRHFLAAFDEGLNDGGNPYTTAHDAQGTVTSATGTTLTDTSATWTASRTSPASNQFAGLANLDVTVMDGDGGNVQTRRILHNTATALTVSEAWDTTPEAGWTYMLGAIEAHWRSPKLGLMRWDRRETVRRLRVLNVTPSSESGDESTVFVAVDGGTEETFVNGADARFAENLVRAGHGREVVVGVRQTSAEATFEVGSLALPFIPAEGI